MAGRFLEMKQRGEKIAMLTAYAMPTARIMDEVGIDAILVGDSLGMVMLGYDTTQKVTLEDVITHLKPVAKAVTKAHIIGDMPYKTFDTPQDAVTNAKKLIQAGANSVKIEGNKPEIVKALRKENIQVMGHVGLTPQTITDFKVQGKDEESAKRIFEDALELEAAGCYAVVIECVPSELAQKITAALKIPTIGIGAGVHCDGQVLVSHDMMGLFTKFKPKFVKRYADIHAELVKAFTEYKKEVKKGTYPDEEHSY